MGTATKQQNKVPELRFPDFHESWSTKKLGDVATFWNGKAHEQAIDEGGQYVVVNSKFVSTDGNVKKYSNQLISELATDDVVLVMSDIPNGKALAKTFLITENKKYTLNQRIGGIKSKSVISPFLKTIVNRNKYFLAFDNGVSQTNLRKDEVLGCPLVFPSIAEQTKIADFLGLVDEWLDNFRRQKTALETYKRGMMQKLFTQQVRFKDDNDKDFPTWQQKKLGSVFSATSGIGIPKADVVENGEHECVLYGELYTKYREVITDVVSRTNSTEGLLSLEGDLLIPTSTTTSAIDLANVTAINKAGVKLAGGICVLRAKLPVNANFYAYYLSHHKRTELAKYGQGVTIYHIYYSQFKKMEIDLPDVKEQEKIADFLTSIDQAITVKSEEIAKVEQWKKGLMHKMFV